MLSAVIGQHTRNRALEAMEAQHAFYAQIEEKVPHPRNINPDSRKVYIIGSLRNTTLAGTANHLRELMGPNVTIFDDWMCAGPNADDAWRDHEQGRNITFLQALELPAAKHVFAFDKCHLTESDAVVLIAPAGKSAHLELGWSLGKGKPGYILLDNPDRWDVMYQFATGITENLEELATMLSEQLYADRT